MDQMVIWRACWLLSTAMMIVAVLAIRPTDLEAQSDPHCGEIVTGCDSGWPNAHNMNQNELDENEKGEVGFHGTCALCTQGGAEHEPEYCHPTCGFTEEEQEDLAVVLDQMTEAFLAGDLGRLGTASMLAPYRVSIHSDRRALQVYGCGDQVVASYPLDDSSRSLVEAISIFRGAPSEVQRALRW